MIPKFLYILCSWGHTTGLHGAYRSPLDDAYQYYALQNPMDAGIGTCKFFVDCYSLSSQSSEHQIEVIIAGCII